MGKLSLTVASRGYSPDVGRASHHSGCSCCGAQALGRVGSVAVAQGLRGPAAHGIFLDQRSNPCPLHWQVDP